MRHPFAGFFQRWQERSRRDALDTSEVELGHGRIGLRPASIGQQSSNPHQIPSSFAEDFGDDLQNFTLEKPSRNYLRYLGFDSLKNRGAFSLLISYGYDQNSGELVSKPPGDFTWYRCLKDLRELLQRNSDADFDFLVIYADLQVDIQDPLTQLQQYFLSESGAAREVQRISKLLVILIAAKEWNLSPEDVQELTGLLTQKRTNVLLKRKLAKLMSPPHERTQVLRKGRMWKANLPSSRPLIGPRMTTQDIFTFEYPTEKTIASFHSDLSVYIYRPFTEFPRTERLNFCLFHQQSKNSRKLLMIVPNRQALGRWPKAKTWHGEVMEIAKCAVKRMRLCYIDFAQQIVEELNYLEIQGRKRPSGSKLQHLLHIEDCIRIAVPTCQTNTETIKRLLRYFDENLDTSLAEKYAEDRRDVGIFSSDLDYFAAKLDSLAKDLHRIHRTTREQLDLVQIRRTTVLTFLAGLYIPMSFVSSFFGMNINQLDDEVSSWTNQTFIDPKDTTKTVGFNITETTTRGGSQSYDLALFWTISAPLTFGTIVLPLIFGAIFRWVLKNSLAVACAPLIVASPSSLELGITFFSISMPFFLANVWSSLNQSGRKARYFWACMLFLWVVVVFGKHIVLQYRPELCTEGVWCRMDWGWYSAGFVYWLLLISAYWRKPEWFYTLHGNAEERDDKDEETD